MSQILRCRTGFLIPTVVWLLAGSVQAQTTTGAIDGIIRDPGKQVVPGVQVVVNSPALIQHDLTVYSNQQGYYRVPAVPPGVYVVTFQLQGFTTLERTGLIVTAGQATSVDVELKLATVTESLTVVGESPTVDPSNAKMAFTYTQSLVENLPTAREFSKMLYTIPGVESSVNSAAGGTTSGSVEYENVLGAGGLANWYKFDGANVTDPRTGTNQTQLFSYDIIDEVQILKGAKPAEVGFAYGGFFQVITKSGGNDFHGVASTYYSGDNLQGNNIDDRLFSAGITSGDRVISAYDPSASLGGRFVRDKLWWFASARRRSQTLAPTGFTGGNQEDRVHSYFWKNTFQPHPRHTLTAEVNDWDQHVDPWIGYAQPARLLADRRATMVRPLGGTTAIARWRGVLSNTLFTDVGFAFSKEYLNRFDQPNSDVGIQDSVTGIKYRQWGFDVQEYPAKNWHYNGSLSWFVPDAAGRHDFKIGGEYTHGNVDGKDRWLGDHRMIVANLAPSQVLIFNTPTEQIRDTYLGSLYAQDAWTIRNRLTLNVGARYDRIRMADQDAPAGGGLYANTYLGDRYPVLKQQIVPGGPLLTWNNVAPRVAASLSVAQRTAVKTSYSRYYHGNLQVPTGGVATLTFEWADLSRDGEYQLGEEGRLLSQSGGRGTSVDPSIRQPFSDEAVVGVSRELFTDFSLNANFIYRRSDDLTDTVNIGIPFDTYMPVQIADPGNDGRVGSSDDAVLTVYAQDPATFGRNVLRFTNPNQYGFPDNRTYKGIELIANKRLSHRWQFVASVVAGRMEVTAPADAGSSSGIFQTPNSLLNARGKDPMNQTSQVKLLGTYQAPYGVVVSGSYRWSSGIPYTRQLVVRGLPQGVITVFAEPRGSRETDVNNLLDFRVEKTLKLARAMGLGLILDVFNLNNASTVAQYGSRTAVDLGVPGLVRNPRLARVGVRFIW